MISISKEELDKSLETYKNVSTEMVKKLNKKFKLVLFLYNKNVLFIMFLFVTMLPSFLLYLFAGINYATNLIASCMFLLYPILFFIYKRTFLRYSEIEDEYFRKKVGIFEHVLRDRKEKGVK